MARRRPWFGLIALLAISGCDDAAASTKAVQEAAMPEDVRRMHEHLLDLSHGEGSMSDLRIELMDGSRSSHRSFQIEAGHLVSKEWRSPGSPMIQREGSVTDSRVRELLQTLIAKRYWTFQGTRFIPDAPMFLFRFYYGDATYVDFLCDAEEFQKSPTRVAIRDAFLTFVSETEMIPVPAK